MNQSTRLTQPRRRHPLKVDNKKKSTAQRKAKIEAMRGRARDMFATISTESEAQHLLRNLVSVRTPQAKCVLAVRL